MQTTLLAVVTALPASQPPAQSRVEDGREMRKAGGFCVFKGRKVSKQPRRLVEIKMSALPALAGSQRSQFGMQEPASTMPATEELLQRNQPDFCLSELTRSYRSIFEAILVK